jgi:hypothetical protein
MTIDDASRSSRRAVRACGGVLFPCVLAAALAGFSAAALAGGGSPPCDPGPTWWEVDRIGEDNTLTNQNPGAGLSVTGNGPNFYHTHTAHWVQSKDAKALEARFIVWGSEPGWVPFTSWEHAFEQFCYSVHFMEGNFDDFAELSFPTDGDPKIFFGCGWQGGGPTDIEKRDEVFGCVGSQCQFTTGGMVYLTVWNGHHR